MVLDMLLMSNVQQEEVLPMLYCKPYLPTYQAFAKLCQRLLDADQKWDKYVIC
jgi:hypothetical protein